MKHTFDRRKMLIGAGLAASGLTALVPARAPMARGHEQGDMVRLIANENPYGPSPAARAVLAESIGESWKYAYRQEARLKQLIADAEDVSPRHVMISAGSGEILRIVSLMQLRQGGELIAARPTFSFSQQYARELGADVVDVDLDDNMRHDLEAMSAKISSKTRLVYVCNPNNPTGTLVAGSVMRQFVADVSQRALVLVDEAYLDLSDDRAEHTAVDRVRADDRVIVTRTFSKLHGMAGLRIGYAIASPDLIKQLEGLRMSILNLPGLRAATASYADHEFQDFSRRKIHQSVSITTALFDELGLHYTPTRGNFVLFDTGGSVREFGAAMRERGYLTGFSYAPYKTWCRISMGTTEQMRGFVAAARAYFTT